MKHETKEEFYKTLIDLHKKLGQGMSGIVKVNSTAYDQYIEEFIEEGLIVACDTGGSMGHSESNIFYMPTKGYNVWTDEGTDGRIDKHKGRYLTYVRLYLGCLPEESESEKGSTARIIAPTASDLLESVDYMKVYVEWLERNEKELIILKELDNIYMPKVIKLTKKEITFIKSKDWYKDNETLKVCIKQSNEQLEISNKIIANTEKILDLMSSDKTQYAKEIKKYEKDIKNENNEIIFRKKIEKFFNSYKSKDKIQTILK